MTYFDRVEGVGGFQVAKKQQMKSLTQPTYDPLI